MIASSQFSNLQLGNLATWQFGNLAIWQLGNLATWQFGNLARNAELTFNFGNLQNWELSILATYIHKKSKMFQHHTTSKTSKHQLQIPVVWILRSMKKVYDDLIIINL